MNIQMIPLTQLVPSPANVRKTRVKTGIEELAASIAAHGLLQNLLVQPASAETFEVVAGGRRHAALKWLAKRKKIAGDYPVPCEVRDGQDATEKRPKLTSATGDRWRSVKHELVRPDQRRVLPRRHE